MVRASEFAQEPNDPPRAGRSAREPDRSKRDANLCRGVVQIERLRALEHAHMQKRDRDPTRDRRSPSRKQAKERSIEQLQPAKARRDAETQHTRHQSERVTAARCPHYADHRAQVNEQDRRPENSGRNPAERSGGNSRKNVLRTFGHRLLQEPVSRRRSQTNRVCCPPSPMSSVFASSPRRSSATFRPHW